jgi:NADPH-dependent 2,4-dienoyl-CoA reductase/sulfur reductase-like enzyme
MCVNENTYRVASVELSAFGGQMRRRAKRNFLSKKSMDFFDKLIMYPRGDFSMKTAAIIGFGCAGYSAARAIRANEPDTVIHIYSETVEAPYNPMLTTYYVSGKIGERDMFPLGDLTAAARELKAEIFCTTPVKKLRARQREIELADGTVSRYDDIVIATGAGAVIPPIGKLPERGIYTMRTAGDARRLEKALEAGVSSALVVGAQMVGIKVVELLVKRGIDTTMADMERQMFPASAYPDTAAIIAQRLEKAGVHLRLGSAVSCVKERGEALVTTFADGSVVESDIVVFCSGIRPNIAFVDRMEIEVGVGIRADEHMRTNVPHIYAAGDCCQTRDVLTGKDAYIGLWANSVTQGRTAGSNISGREARYQGNLIQNITHYMDTDFISVGDVKSPGEHISWQRRDGAWRMEATMSGGKIASLNILDNANVSGPVKNVLLRQATHPDESMTDAAKLILVRAGMPESIIKALGGEGK